MNRATNLDLIIIFDKLIIKIKNSIGSYTNIVFILAHIIGVHTTLKSKREIAYEKCLLINTFFNGGMYFLVYVLVNREI